MASSSEIIYTHPTEGEIVPVTITYDPNNDYPVYASQPQDETSYQINELCLEQQQNLKNLLISWNCGYIFKKCVDEYVDIECLKLFKLHHIQTLMLGFPLGNTVWFENKLCNCQISEAASSTPSEGHFQPACNHQTTECEEKIINVKEIIEQTNYGLEIISQYNVDKKMTETQRNFIVNGIIDFIVTKNIKISTNFAKNIAEQIVSVFIYEEISTYYNKIKGKHVTGKIYQKYFNKTKSLQNVGLKKKATEKCDEEPVKKSPKLVPEENIASYLEDLKSPECTWSEIEDKWGKTSKYRLNEMHKYENTSQVLDKWNHFSNPLGYRLVLLDFETMFPAATDMLGLVDVFPGQMLPTFKAKIKDTSARSFVDLLNTDKLSQNGQLLTTFFLLHNILVPTARSVVNINHEKKHKKYSIRDSQAAFLIVGNNVQHLEEMLLKRIEQGLPIQPLLLITGTINDPKEIGVYYDRIRYNLSCISRAIDVCFKLFHIFNLKYPVAANLFWSFFQQFFYNIEALDKDQHHSVKNLINELKLNK